MLWIYKYIRIFYIVHKSNIIIHWLFKQNWHDQYIYLLYLYHACSIKPVYESSRAAHTADNHDKINNNIYYLLEFDSILFSF